MNIFVCKMHFFLEIYKIFILTLWIYFQFLAEPSNTATKRKFYVLEVILFVWGSRIDNKINGSQACIWQSLLRLAYKEKPDFSTKKLLRSYPKRQKQKFLVIFWNNLVRSYIQARRKSDCQMQHWR